MACAAHRARSSLAEMDGGTIMSGHDQLVLAACQVAPDKGIVLVQRNGVRPPLRMLRTWESGMRLIRPCRVTIVM